MWRWKVKSPASRPYIGRSRRRHERYKTDSVRSPLGELLDLSTSGARLAVKSVSTYQRGSIIRFPLISTTGRMVVDAQVAWVQRATLSIRGEGQIGLRFVHVSAGTRKALETLARLGFFPNRDLDFDMSEERPGEVAASAKPAVSQTLMQHYQTLGLTPGASGEQVHSAYRKLARENHPDVAKCPEAQVRFERICAAYEALRELAA